MILQHTHNTSQKMDLNYLRNKTYTEKLSYVCESCGNRRYTETLNPNTIIFIKNPLLKVLFRRIDCLFRRCLVPLRTPLNITHA
jgi:hypothetical protein